MVEYLGFDPNIIALIVGDIILLLMSGMMSSSEVAYFSLTPAELRRIKRGGSVATDAASKLLDNPDQLLATILVVNNMVNIGTVVLSTQILNSLFVFHRFGFLVHTVVVTFILLLCGEVLPKVFAQGSTMRVALWFAQPLTLLRWLVYPLGYVLVRTSNVASERLMQRSNDISIEDLADAVDMTTSTSTEEQKILSGIVNFADREVEEIMRPRMDIVGVEQTMSFSEVKQTITTSGYSRLPVYSETIDNIKGTLFVKDLIAYANRTDDFGWQSLIREPYIVPMHKQVTDLLEDFRHDKVHMAIVVDEYGATQGLVTLEDILEEVVGEISDESDIDESFYERIDKCTYIFEGKTHIVDMLRVLQLDDELFEDVQGRAETIAGLLLEIKRNFLKKGEQLSSHGIRFVVTAVDGHRIDKIKVILPNND
ncbi:MAG: gliding motility-associated protein GldE [Alistipes sp.]|nr:gliding motility-associated protein GldE [Alistipes sp.]MBQ6869479.1 gliding motility-associated protein GldE [Alistipes sp.]